MTPPVSGGLTAALAGALLLTACAPAPPMAQPQDVRAFEQSLTRGGGGSGAVSRPASQNPFAPRVTLGPPPNPLVPQPLAPPEAIVAPPAPPIAEQAVTDLERRRDDLFYGTEADCRAARGTFTVRGCLP